MVRSVCGAEVGVHVSDELRSEWVKAVNEYLRAEFDGDVRPTEKKVNGVVNRFFDNRLPPKARDHRLCITDENFFDEHVGGVDNAPGLIESMLGKTITSGNNTHPDTPKIAEAMKVTYALEFEAR